MIHDSSATEITLKQNPSLKLPISSRPPVKPFLVLIMGLMISMLKDFCVLVRSFRLEVRAKSPSLFNTNQKLSYLGTLIGPYSSTLESDDSLSSSSAGIFG